MLEEALSYPTESENSLVTILIGGALMLFSFLVVPIFVVLGYMVRVLESSSRGGTEPPEFEDWATLLVDGVKAFVVSFAYGLIPMVFMLVMFLAIGLGGSAGNRSGGILAGFGLLGLLVAFIAALFIQYLLPAALTNFGREGSVSAAFDFEALKPVITSNSYIVAVVISVVIAFVGGIVVNIVGAITLGLGFLIAPFFYFWLYLVFLHMLGRAFGEVVGMDSTGGAAGDVTLAD